MDPAVKSRLESRRQLWRAVRDGEVPIPKTVEDIAAERRALRRRWWMADDLAEQPPPEHAADPLVNGSELRRRRGSRRHATRSRLAVAS